MQNSARWVLPVMSVSRCRSARSTIHGGASRCPLSLAISAKAISNSYSADSRPSSTLRRPDLLVSMLTYWQRHPEPSGEQIGQCRMTLPVGEHRHQQIGAPQQGRSGGTDAAEGDV